MAALPPGCKPLANIEKGKKSFVIKKSKYKSTIQVLLKRQAFYVTKMQDVDRLQEDELFMDWELKLNGSGDVHISWWNQIDQAWAIAQFVANWVTAEGDRPCC